MEKKYNMDGILNWRFRMIALQVVSKGRDKVHQITSSRISICPCSVSRPLLPHFCCCLGLLPSELLCLDRPGHSCKFTTVFQLKSLFSWQAFVLNIVLLEEAKRFGSRVSY